MLEIPRDLELKVNKDIEALNCAVEGLSINTNEDYENAAILLTKAKQRIKRLEELRKQLIKPIQDTVKEANNKFKLLSEPFVKLENNLKSVMMVYIKKEEERARIEAEEAKKEAERSRKEAESSNQQYIEKPVIIETPDLNKRTESGFVHTKKRWTFEVVDASKIPKKYWTVDNVAINNEIRSGIREIKGLRIYQESELAVR